MAEKSEPLSTDVKFPCAPPVMETHRKASALLADNNSFTPKLLGPDFIPSQRKHQRTEERKGRARQDQAAESENGWR